MSRKKDVRDTAAETTHTAVERGTEILEQALEALAPLLNTASEKTESAREQLAPYAEQAKDKLAPAADAAKVKVAPLAATAAVGATKARKQLEPHLEAAADKVQPAVDQARSTVQEDLVPQLVELLHQAESHPAVNEANKRSHAAVAALRGELELPEKKKRNVAGSVAKVAAVGTVIAAVGVAVRQFLATRDDAWTAHQPSDAYRADESDKTVVTEQSPAAATWVDAASDDATLDRAETEPADGSLAVTEPSPEERMGAEGGPAHTEHVAESLNVLNEYGEGSYVGDEPPAEYAVKGNERSMKYHTSDSAGYERTIADVWFRSTEAAEKAGFTRAQR